MAEVKRYFANEMNRRWMCTIIILCFFTSGTINSVAFNSWNCFVGMQTGNTVFAALGITGQPQATHRQQYYKALVSIASFCSGTLFFHFLHRYPRLTQKSTARTRWVFLTSFFIQAMLIILAAVFVTLGLVSNRPYVTGTFSSGSHRKGGISTATNFMDLAPIAFLAFEAAGQVCLSRVLDVIDLPTIVLSTLFHDFIADLYGLLASWRRSRSVSDFFLVQEKRQAQRLGSILALFAGAIVGGEMFKLQGGMSGALWMAAGIKLGICVAWLAWQRDGNAEDAFLPK